LVIGRPITGQPDPAAAAKKIVEEIRKLNPLFPELRVIDDRTPRAGELNMAIDELLLQTAHVPILRF